MVGKSKEQYLWHQLHEIQSSASPSEVLLEQSRLFVTWSLWLFLTHWSGDSRAEWAQPRLCDRPRSRTASSGRGEACVLAREQTLPADPPRRPSLQLPAAPGPACRRQGRSCAVGESADWPKPSSHSAGGTGDSFTLPDDSEGWWWGARQGTSWQKVRCPSQHQCHQGRRATVSFQAGGGGVGQSPVCSLCPRKLSRVSAPTRF